MISGVLDLPRYAFFPEFFRPESREKTRLKPQPLTAVLCAPQVQLAELAERAGLREDDLMLDSKFGYRWSSVSTVSLSPQI